MQNVQTGGIGGAIRDRDGNVRSFSGPMESQDASEAEVFALLINCLELARFICFHPILEGDSFLVSQWGLGRAIHLWRLANRVAEV